MLRDKLKWLSDIHDIIQVEIWPLRENIFHGYQNCRQWLFFNGFLKLGSLAQKMLNLKQI